MYYKNKIKVIKIYRYDNHTKRYMLIKNKKTFVFLYCYKLKLDQIKKYE